MSPPPGRLQTSWHNGRSPRELLQKREKWLCMKFRGVSLGIDVSPRDCPMAVLAAHLVNM